MIGTIVPKMGSDDRPIPRGPGLGGSAPSSGQSPEREPTGRQAMTCVYPCSHFCLYWTSADDVRTGPRGGVARSSISEMAQNEAKAAQTASTLRVTAVRCGSLGIAKRQKRTQTCAICADFSGWRPLLRRSSSGTRPDGAMEMEKTKPSVWTSGQPPTDRCESARTKPWRRDEH